VGPGHLYLDTARLGRMTAGARAAQVGLARLAGDEGGSPVLERLLRLGLDACGDRFAATYPGLSSWRGVAHLKSQLRALCGGRPDVPVLLAARSAELMKVAARLLFHPCSHVLTTDLNWPPYQEIVTAECRRANRELTAVPLRDDLLRGRGGADEAVDRLVREFVRGRCDGLFLPAVSHLGVRLPAERVVRSVEAVSEVRFAVIDGAQEFCHVPAELRNDFADLYVTGPHKWLGAHTPLGIAFYGRLRSAEYIETVLSRLLKTGELSDPLLRLSRQLEAGALDGTTETVNLLPLFTCQGAATDALAAPDGAPEALAGRLRTADLAASAAEAAGWRPLVAGPALRTGILLLQAEREDARSRHPDATRIGFYERGVTLTTYERGLVRLSLPGVPWGQEERSCLDAALRAMA
jgi:selenocysteine lyase/cysteine desulfurase